MIAIDLNGHRSTGVYAGSLYHLQKRDVIVSPRQRLAGGDWVCRLAGYRHPVLQPAAPVTVTDLDLRTAATTVTVDPYRDPDGYAAIWQAIATRHRADTTGALVAATLVHRLRRPCSTTIDLDPGAYRRLVDVTGMRHLIVHCLLAQLVHAGLLATVDPRLHHSGEVQLAIPNRPGATTGPDAVHTLPAHRDTETPGIAAARSAGPSPVGGQLVTVGGSA